MQTIHLPRNPLAVFRGSRTPPGLYARQKWLGESGTAAWEKDFQGTVADLTAGRSPDGLWNNAPMKTVRHLFGLHLTVREPNSDITASLGRLLTMAGGRPASAGTDVVDRNRIRGLPFAPAAFPEVLMPATLFLASIFGMAADPVVLTLYEQMSTELADSRRIAGMDAGSLHNRLRALVVHPVYAAHPATANIVRWLAGRQTADGDWGPAIPFHQALNALAHLDPALTQGACQRAFARLAGTQNGDGSWGAAACEWNTFLTVHALKNRHLL